MVDNQNEIILRGYRDSDEKQIAYLFYDNFPDTLEPEDICRTWLWQFKNRFSKPSGVSVAELENELVAHYAVMWFSMCCQGQSIEGAISTATVTDVKARGKGLFTKLAKKVFSDVEKDGCRIVFGFPNSQSIRGFIKYLDWFEIAKFPLLLKPVNVSPFLDKFLKNVFLSNIAGWLPNLICPWCFKLVGWPFLNRGMTIESIEKLPDSIADIWESSFASKKIAIERKAAYLNWRYREKPFGDYKIFQTLDDQQNAVGILVISVIEKKGLKIVYIMEMMAKNDNRHVYKSFLNFIDRYAKENGADAVSILCLPNNPNKWLFYRHGLVPVPRKLFPQDIHFCARVNSVDVDKDYVADAENWFITWGDLDIV